MNPNDLLNEIHQPLSIFDEAYDTFNGNLYALSLAVHPFSKHQPKKIFNDLSVSKWRPHEKELNKVVDTLNMRQVRKYIALSQIDYAECLNILECTSEFLRLNDFSLEGVDSKKELRNIEKIIDYAKNIHSTLSRISGKEVKYHKGDQLTLELF